jgi:hypothetical protein
MVAKWYLALRKAQGPVYEPEMPTFGSVADAYENSTYFPTLGKETQRQYRRYSSRQGPGHRGRQAARIRGQGLRQGRAAHQWRARARCWQSVVAHDAAAEAAL